jgi:hypothetical protein
MAMSLGGGTAYWYSFIVVGKRDNPLFEIEFAGPKVRHTQDQFNLIDLN